MKFKKGSIPWNKGKKGIYSKEVLEKMGLGRKGKPSPNKGKKMSEAQKDKLRKSWIYEKRVTPKILETLANNSKKFWGDPIKAEKRKRELRENPSRKGKKQSVEEIEKKRERMKGKKYHLGFTHTEKTKRIISLTHKGKKESPISIKKGVETRKKLYAEHPELRKAISKRTSGENNPMYGKKHSEETRKKMSLAKKGKKRSPEAIINMANGHKGIKRSLEAIEKTRLKMIGFKHKQETKERIKLARMKQVFPTKDTKPERMMQLALALHRIPFEKHKPIFGQPDIFIEPKICVFVDGDYWHRLPKSLLRDAEVNHRLSFLGYQVIRIWESDIKKDANNCAKNIINLIQQLRGVSQ